jgi:EmrB/QacA subfamily drug resistance transporter
MSTTLSETAPRYLTHPEILPVVRGVALCILLSALDMTIVVPAVPKMAAALNGHQHLAWIITAYMLTGTAATPVFGKLSDIYGRRRLLQPAIILFVLASLGCAVAQTLPQMLLLRALQGVGGAGLITLAQTAMADVIPPRERGRYQIYMSGMWGIASLGGPILGGVLTDYVSWRAIFWINLPLGLAAFILSSRALRHLPVHAAAAVKIDYAGALLLMATITVLLILVSTGGDNFPWFSRESAMLAAAGVGFLVLTILQETRAATPMLPLHIFANKVVLGGLALSFTNTLCTFGATLLLPLYFQFILHTNAAISGLYSTPFMLAFVVLSYAGGQISRRIGRTKPTMLIALLLCLAGLCLLASMSSSTPVALSLVYMMVLGSGIGLVQPNITVAIQNAAARPDVGIATGCMLLFRAIGGATGATLAGIIMLRHGFPAAFLGCAAFALLAIAIAAMMQDLSLRSAN